MYSSKVSVNILTSLLIKAGVEHAVVCPGSRNSPIVHNLNECDEIQCYPVTDERSAGFFAMGICQQVQQPVVLCVTSGTALLNTCPAVAEAYYQHLPLIVISADRPAMWIDQLDGQTLPQRDALGKLVKKAVNLPEPHTDDEHWY
jgi:2-succinyl-5-enolpyruvyl-6-hydroxy-3-cyclohexene-1-carboxylate synthase